MWRNVKYDNCLAYDCGQLALAICNTVNIIGQEWCKNMPALKRSGKKYEVYAHSEQNSRRKMEDKHMILTEFNNLFGLDMVNKIFKNVWFKSCPLICLPNWFFRFFRVKRILLCLMAMEVLTVQIILLLIFITTLQDKKCSCQILMKL